MKSYKLCFDNTISNFLQIDIKKVLENKIGLPTQDADITYIVSSINSIPIITKETNIYDDVCASSNLLYQEKLWNECLYYIKKTSDTLILPSSPLFEDIALDLSQKLQLISHFPFYSHHNISDFDNIVMIGNGDFPVLEFNKNIELFTLDPNIEIDNIEKYDIINIISVNIPDILLKYNNINYIDITPVIVNCIITDFYQF